MPELTSGTAYELSSKHDKPVVVLIHGLGANRHMWREFLPALSLDYRVLTYDLFGHGDSVQPPSTPSLRLFADQLKQLLEDLQIKSCVAVGYSLGGMINRRFAMDFPDRVQALVILNSPHQRSPREQRVIEQRVRNTAAGGAEATIETSLARWFTPEFRSNRPDVVEEVRNWILSSDPVCYTQCREVLACGVKELICPNPPISQPALVMTCENDSGSTPAMSYAIAAEIQNVQTIIVPNLQHLGLLENSAAFIQPLVDFFASALD